ncbi:MAG: hypothetical protein Q8P67_15425, partial [archaeon]|nr:hypothetical protein [archaeon]
KTIQSKHRNSRGYDAEKLRQQKSESREVTAVVVAESSTRRAFAISEISEYSEEVQRKIQRQQARLASLKGISAPPSQPHQPHQPCQPHQQVSSEEEKDPRPLDPSASTLTLTSAIESPLQDDTIALLTSAQLRREFYSCKGDQQKKSVEERLSALSNRLKKVSSAKPPPVSPSLASPVPSLASPVPSPASQPPVEFDILKALDDLTSSLDLPDLLGLVEQHSSPSQHPELLHSPIQELPKTSSLLSVELPAEPTPSEPLVPPKEKSSSTIDRVNLSNISSEPDESESNDDGLPSSRLEESQKRPGEIPKKPAATDWDNLSDASASDDNSKPKSKSDSESEHEETVPAVSTPAWMPVKKTAIDWNQLSSDSESDSEKHHGAKEAAVVVSTLQANKPEAKKSAIAWDQLSDGSTGDESDKQEEEAGDPAQKRGGAKTIDWGNLSNEGSTEDDGSEGSSESQSEEEDQASKQASAVRSRLWAALQEEEEEAAAERVQADLLKQARMALKPTVVVTGSDANAADDSRGKANPGNDLSAADQPHLTKTKSVGSFMTKAKQMTGLSRKPDQSEELSSAKPRPNLSPSRHAGKKPGKFHLFAGSSKKAAAVAPAKPPPPSALSPPVQRAATVSPPIPASPAASTLRCDPFFSMILGSSSAASPPPVISSPPLIFASPSIASAPLLTVLTSPTEPLSPVQSLPLASASSSSPDSSPQIDSPSEPQVEASSKLAAVLRMLTTNLERHNHLLQTSPLLSRPHSFSSPPPVAIPDPDLEKQQQQPDHLEARNTAASGSAGPLVMSSHRYTPDQRCPVDMVARQGTSHSVKTSITTVSGKSFILPAPDSRLKPPPKPLKPGQVQSPTP